MDAVVDIVSREFESGLNFSHKGEQQSELLARGERQSSVHRHQRFFAQVMRRQVTIEIKQSSFSPRNDACEISE